MNQAVMKIAANATQGWMIASRSTGGITAIAALIGTLGTIAVGGRRLLRALAWFVLGPFRWFNEQSEAAHQIEQLSNTLKKVVAELTPNGGTSMKDAIGRIDRRCAAMEEGRIIDGQWVWALLMDGADGAFELDAVGGVTKTNRTLCRLLGRQSEELLGRGWEQCVVAGERANVIEEWDRCVAVGREMFMQVHFERPDRSRVLLQIHSYPLRNAGGKPLKFIARCHLIPTEVDKP